MNFDPKEFLSKTSLSVAGLVVLLFGLYFAISGTQQSTDTRSRASEMVITPGPTSTVSQEGSSLNVLDFNILVSCINGTISCTAEQKMQADIDHNGTLDQQDINLFISQTNSLAK